MLKDPHGRIVDYVRLSVTDRCNLRCNYCLPEGFTNFLPKNELLTFEELHRLLTLLNSLGVSKLRITGGEPFVRKDLMQFLRWVNDTIPFKSKHITTNGVLTLPHVAELEALGFDGVNLSLDTLDRDRFKSITGRDRFEQVMATLRALMKTKMRIRINAVVLPEQNLEDLITMTEFTKDKNIEVRFIEEMPFNGKGERKPTFMDHKAIEEYISARFDLSPMDSDRNGTARRFGIAGHKGSIGIIPAFSRTFCGTCNRLRIDPKGNIQTCLYGKKQNDLFHLLRENASDALITEYIQATIARRKINGFEAERELLDAGNELASMATIGG